MNAKTIKMKIIDKYIDDRHIFNQIDEQQLLKTMKFLTYLIQQDFQGVFFSDPKYAFQNYKNLLQKPFLTNTCLHFVDISYSMFPSIILFNDNYPKVQFFNMFEGLVFILLLIHTSNLIIYLQQKFPNDRILKHRFRSEYQRWDLRLEKLLKSRFHQQLQQLKKDKFFLDVYFTNPTNESSSLQSPCRIIQVKNSEQTPVISNKSCPKAPAHRNNIRISKKYIVK